MTITVDITPEVKAALARQAAAEGREVESYAASLLEQAVHPAAAPPTPRSAQEREYFCLSADSQRHTGCPHGRFGTRSRSLRLP